MLGRVFICLVLFLGLSFSRAPARERIDDSGLDHCRKSNEDRIPVLVWDTGRNLTNSSPSPRPIAGGTFVYFSLIVASGNTDDTTCIMQPEYKIYNFELPNRHGDPTDGGFRVHLRGNVQFHHGDCIFSGFYVSEPISGMRQGWTDVSLRAAPVPEYEHYCLADINPAPRASHRKALPPCDGATSNRIPVSIWQPELTSDGELRSAPPQGDGRIVYAFIDVKKDASGACLGWSDGRFNFRFPNKTGALDTKGVVVTLRGNDRPEPGSCRLSGYYMNEHRFEKQDGWGTTYFGSVDSERLIGSGEFCLAGEAPSDFRSR